MSSPFRHINDMFTLCSELYVEEHSVVARSGKRDVHTGMTLLSPYRFPPGCNSGVYASFAVSRSAPGLDRWVHIKALPNKGLFRNVPMSVHSFHVKR